MIKLTDCSISFSSCHRFLNLSVDDTQTCPVISIISNTVWTIGMLMTTQSYKKKKFFSQD